NRRRVWAVGLMNVEIMPLLRMRALESEQVLHKFELLQLRHVERVPAQPGQRPVLAIGIVVARLAARKLIAGTQHRGALRHQQRCQQVALLPRAQNVYLGNQRGPLDTVVVAVILRMPVAIVLEIRLIVLRAVADEIRQRKTVVAGYVVDASRGSAPGMLEDVAGAMHTARELRQHAGIAAPEAPHDVAIAIVPFAPARGEMS